MRTPFDYMKTAKYKNYIRNREIFEEKSAGIFRAIVNSRIKLELMGSGAIVQNDTVFSGFSGGKGNYSAIGDLIVPSNLLSSITSTYISYATTGKVLFDSDENEYLLQKVKSAITEQSIGGSCLMKIIERDGLPYINIFNAISYYAVEDEDIQDLTQAFVIFNLVEESQDIEKYLLEIHEGKEVSYKYIKKTTKDDTTTIKYEECVIEGMDQKEDEEGVTYSYEILDKIAVAEVVNMAFSGNSDYTDDNVALLREIVVTNTINSQTFDKISNPLLALPEGALEYDEHGNARVNLNDRVVIIRDSDTGGGKPEQISLESRIEQSDKHRENLESQVYTSLAVNPTALGVGGGGNLSGIAIERMLSNTTARVIDKRKSVAKAIFAISGVKIDFSDPVGEDYKELVTTTKTAVDAGIMSKKEGSKRIGNEDDYTQIQKEEAEERGAQYEGFKEPKEDDTKGE